MLLVIFLGGPASSSVCISFTKHYSAGGGTGTYCTGGKGAVVSARYSVDPSLWNSVISVAAASVGATYAGSGTAAPLGGFGTGYGGDANYNNPVSYGTGGGGASSIVVAVSVFERFFQLNT